MTALLAEVDGDPQAFVAVVLDGLHFASPHRDVLAEALADFGLGSAGPEAAGVVENVGCELAQLVDAVGEGAGGHGCGSGRGLWGLVPAQPSGTLGYDTSLTMSEEHVDRPEPVSKTRRKREMHARQDLGEELVGLTEPQLAQLELPEKLLDAVLLAKRIQKFGALRRQLQYVGRLMRDVDSAAIAAQLEAWKGKSRDAAARLHLLERWRDRLIASDTAMAELAAAYPGCEVQQLRTLVRNARREQALGAAPESARELFRALKVAIPEIAAAGPED